MAASANHLLCTLATTPSTTIVPDAVKGLKKPVRCSVVTLSTRNGELRPPSARQWSWFDSWLAVRNQRQVWSVLKCRCRACPNRTGLTRAALLNLQAAGSTARVSAAAPWWNLAGGSYCCGRCSIWPCPIRHARPRTFRSEEGQTTRRSALGSPSRAQTSMSGCTSRARRITRRLQAAAFTAPLAEPVGRKWSPLSVRACRRQTREMSGQRMKEHLAISRIEHTSVTVIGARSTPRHRRDMVNTSLAANDVQGNNNVHGRRARLRPSNHTTRR